VKISIWIIVSIFIIFSAIVWLSNNAYSQSGNCDPAYPDLCVASPPPDLNCPDILDNEFTMLPPDPHGFDRDLDGVGCE
jgi:hypothetical protein